jgi:hypothetical protein
MNKIKRKYKKIIVLHYEYVNSSEAENALAEVFDDIFIRLIKKSKVDGLAKYVSKKDIFVKTISR